MCAIEQLNNFKKADRQQCYSSMERVPSVTVASLKIKQKTQAPISQCQILSKSRKLIKGHLEWAPCSLLTTHHYFVYDLVYMNMTNAFFLSQGSVFKYKGETKKPPLCFSFTEMMQRPSKIDEILYGHYGKFSVTFTCFHQLTIYALWCC